MRECILSSCQTKTLPFYPFPAPAPQIECGFWIVIYEQHSNHIIDGMAAIAAKTTARPHICCLEAATDVENGLPPPMPFSDVLVLELEPEVEVEDGSGEPVLAVIEVTNVNKVPV